MASPIIRDLLPATAAFINLHRSSPPPYSGGGHHGGMFEVTALGVFSVVTAAVLVLGEGARIT